MLPWVNLDDIYELKNDMTFQWAQLKHAILARWEKVIFVYSDINKNGLYQNHHVIKEPGFLSVNNLFSKEKCSILMWNAVNKQTSNVSFEKLFENTTLVWSKIYLSPRLVTIFTTLRSFNIRFLITYFCSRKSMDKIPNRFYAAIIYTTDCDSWTI